MGQRKGAGLKFGARIVTKRSPRDRYNHPPDKGLNQMGCTQNPDSKLSMVHVPLPRLTTRWDVDFTRETSDRPNLLTGTPEFRVVYSDSEESLLKRV
jgi:hypothetical protein